MYVIKRDGRKVEFDKNKIKNAILKAMKSETGNGAREKIASDIANEIEVSISGEDHISVPEIESLVFDKLISKKQRLTAKSYEGYRKVRELQRKTKSDIDKEISELVDGTSEYWNTENSNKNSMLVTTQRDYLAGIVSSDYARRFMFSPEVVQAHDEGIIHIHDLDYMAQSSLYNCCLINLDDCLQNGTVINKVKINKPHRLVTAMTIATQIITAVTSSQYGGATISLTALAPFVRDSYEIFLKKYRDRGMSEDLSVKYAREDLKKEIEDGVQTFNYQVNSMSTVNGQAPFLSVFMYINETEEYKPELVMLIEEFLKQRIKGMQNEVGAYVTQAFPKLLYVLTENNIREGQPYYYLTELAAKCTAKRMVPDYISEKIMLRDKGDVYPCMGCRSFLTPDRFTDSGILNPSKAKNWDGKHKYYGRMNAGVITINLPDVALSSGGDIGAFWKIFDERLELCHSALLSKHKKLRGTISDVAPILWQDGAIARLDKGEKIDELLFNGYSTISLGYAGLYECVKYMTGESHSGGKGMEFGFKVMQHLNDACSMWKSEENVDYSVYGSPIESVTYKFAKCLKKRFGEIESVTDHNYVTNSYHVNVREEINPFDKLAIESEYQKLSPGGAISYIESSDLTGNIPALLEVIQYIYDNIMYAEINTKSDYCHCCGYDGEIKIIDVDGKLIWECPNCGNRDQTKMSAARRTCGYIGTNFWNQGRTEEIKERYVHLDDHEVKE